MSQGYAKQMQGKLVDLITCSYFWS